MVAPSFFLCFHCPQVQALREFSVSPHKRATRAYFAIVRPLAKAPQSSGFHDGVDPSGSAGLYFTLMTVVAGMGKIIAI